MEPRIALSSTNGFSSFFTNIIDSITGKSTKTSTSTTPHISAAKAAQLKEIRHERLLNWDAAHPHAKPRA
jgi:hypothetical protein